MPLYKPSELQKLQIQPKKSLSQNFLIDRNILEKICQVAEVCASDTILEIGPGPGALTEQLLAKGAKVIAIEKDHALAERLSSLGLANLTVICENFLDFPLQTLSSSCKIVANLPYHITSKVLEKCICTFPKIQSLTVMMQYEVGQKLLAQQPANALSLFLQAYSTFSYCFKVKPTSFFPIPSVSSCVMQFTLKEFPFSFDQKEFFDLIKQSFSQKRKMLTSSLKEGFSLETIQKALQTANLPLSARPQELSLEKFAAFFIALQKEKST